MRLLSLSARVKVQASTNEKWSTIQALWYGIQRERASTFREIKIDTERERETEQENVSMCVVCVSE